MKRHRWAEKTTISLNKSECECQNGCGIVKVSRHEFEHGTPLHWTEFWRGLDRLQCEGTPPCTGSAKAMEYDARNYPL